MGAAGEGVIVRESEVVHQAPSGVLSPLAAASSYALATSHVGGAAAPSGTPRLPPSGSSHAMTVTANTATTEATTYALKR